MKLNNIITENFSTVSINGILFSLNNDEKNIYDKIKKDPERKLFKKDLDEFDQRIASNMVTRGLLQRRKNPQHEIYFTTKGRRKNAVYNRPLDEVAPPDTASEKWIEKNKDRFKEKYGKNYKKYLYGKAWNMYNGSNLKETLQLQAILDKYTLTEATTAYHGSPYDFDEFDVKFIGAGEGHQVHGWGLYFAEDKSISNDYYRQMNRRESIKSYTLNGKDYPRGTVMYKILTIIDKTGKKQNAIDALNKILEDTAWISAHPGYDNEIKKIIDTVKKIKEKSLQANIQMKQGQLFTVEIPDKKYFLDEDLPFSKQSPTVRKAIKNIYKTNNKFDSKYLKNDNYSGKSIYKFIAQVLGGEKNASIALYNENVPGIKYDGYRDKYCFVVFNGKDVKIINKDIKYDDNNINLPDKDLITDDPSAIKKIDNPSEELQKYALELDSSVFKYLKNPSQDIINYAISQDCNNIKYVQNPTKSQINKAINMDYSLSIYFIDSLSDKQILNLIEKDNDLFISYYSKAPARFSKEFFAKCLEKIPYLSREFTNIHFPIQYIDQIIDCYFDNAKQHQNSEVLGRIYEIIEFNKIDINNTSEKIRYVMIFCNYNILNSANEITEKDIQVLIDYIKSNYHFYNELLFQFQPNVILDQNTKNKFIELIKIMAEKDNNIKKFTLIDLFDISEIITMINAMVSLISYTLNKLYENKNGKKLIEFINKLYTDVFSNNKEKIKHLYRTDFSYLYDLKSIILPLKNKIDEDAWYNIMSIIMLMFVHINKKDKQTILNMIQPIPYIFQKQLINQNIEDAVLLSNIDTRIQMKMIERNPFNIKFINNPDSNVIKKAYELNPDTKDYIR